MPQRIPSHRTSPRLEALSHRDYDRSRRDLDSKKFYNGAAWKRLRLSKLRQNPMCELCRPLGMHVVATHVHHKIELQQDRSLGLHIDNLQSLCHPCHSRLHARQSKPLGGGSIR